MNRDNAYMGDKDKTSWVMALIIGLVPLIVRMKVVEVPSAARWLWGDAGGDFADFFSANKLIVLGILTVIAIIIFIKEYKLDIKFNKTILYSVLTYASLAILSTIFAPNGYKMIALFGAPERYEGLIAILLYLILFIIAIRLSQNTANLKLINTGLIIGGVIVALIGLTQFLGVDAMQTDGVKALMLPHEYIHLAPDLKFTFGSGKGNIVYSTLFNPNYVGSYAALLVPISIVTMLYTFLYSKDLSKKIRYTLVTALMITLLFTSRSRGGLVGTTVGLVLILVMLGGHIIKTKKQFLITILVLIIGVFGINLISNGVILSRVKSLPSEVKKLVTKAEETNQLTDIRLDATGVEIDTSLSSFRLEQADGSLVLIDDEGEFIQIEGEEALVPQDERYGHLSLEVASQDEFKVTSTNPHYSLHFIHVEDKFKVVGTGGNLIDIEEVKTWGFEGKEKLGSSRGYIWSRTVPMIQNKWLLGYGLDTYALNFPQHDIIGKINGFGMININVDKPHNLYLQTMVSTGIPSLLALVVLFAAYTVLFIKDLMTSNKDDIRRWMSIAIFAALTSYLVAGLFNDSVISVAPVFWILWGVGVGLTQYKSSTLQS